MLLIKTKLGFSKIHGIGLFADEYIPKGKAIWRFAPVFDVKVSIKDLDKLPKQAQSYIYLDQKTGEYILCSDDARFFNHSITPNTVHFYEKGRYGQTIAVKNIKSGEELTCDYRSFDADFVNRKLVSNSLDNHKIIIKWTTKYATHGRALFATREIKKGEVIGAFDGKIYKAKKASDISNEPPVYAQDHAIQFAKVKYRDSKGIARLISHSCEPNCGIKNKFEIVAMRNIRKGEEISFDYDMSENSDWRMKCECKNKNCRKLIGSYSALPQQLKERYKGYISEYLVT